MKTLSHMPTLLRNCFSKIWNKQFLIFFFFLLLSAMFWTFQTLNEVYEEDFVVPIETKGIPGNVVITSDLPKQFATKASRCSPIATEKSCRASPSTTNSTPTPPDMCACLPPSCSNPLRKH